MSLSPAESQELKRLLAKAKAAAQPPVECESGFGEYDPTTGLFVDSVSGHVTDVWLAAEVEGAMHDGSKRREADSMVLAGPDSKRVSMPKAKAKGVSSHVGADGPSYSMLVSETGIPFPKTDGYEISADGLPPFPAGIHDVTMWGQTLINFGQFKGKLTYEELIKSDDERSQSYVKWCRARSLSAQGMLKDLCNYMDHYFAGGNQRSGFKIPGTDQFRVLRPQ